MKGGERMEAITIDKDELLELLASYLLLDPEKDSTITQAHIDGDNITFTISPNP